MEPKSVNLKPIIKISTFSSIMCRKHIRKICESEELSLKRNVCNFSVDYNAINKSSIVCINVIEVVMLLTTYPQIMCTQ